MSDAKLRELRRWLSGDHEACPGSGVRWCSMKSEPSLYHDEGNRTAWFVRTDIIAQIDRLLAEPEPQCSHDLRWVARTGSYSEPFKRCEKCGFYEMTPPRESSALECARLYGLVGPDGRGRC